MIYNRDYSKLTEQEQQQYNSAKEYLISKGALISSVSLKEYYNLLPVAAYHFESLFPNNYFLHDHEKHKDCYSILNDFSKIIRNNDSTEREILNFIRDKEAYFILESLFEFYDFGHHDESYP